MFEDFLVQFLAAIAAAGAIALAQSAYKKYKATHDYTKITISFVVDIFIGIACMVVCLKFATTVAAQVIFACCSALAFGSASFMFISTLRVLKLLSEVVDSVSKVNTKDHDNKDL